MVEPTAPVPREQRVIDLTGDGQKIPDLPTVTSGTSVIFLPYLRVALSSQRLKLFDRLQLVLASTGSDREGKAYLSLHCRRGKHGAEFDVWTSEHAPVAEVQAQHAILSAFLEQAIKELGGLYAAPM